MVDVKDQLQKMKMIGLFYLTEQQVKMIDTFDQILLVIFMISHVSAFIALQYESAPYGKFSENPNFKSKFLIRINGKFVFFHLSFKFSRLGFSIQESASFFIFIYIIYKYSMITKQFSSYQWIPTILFPSHYFYRFVIYPLRTHSMSNSNILIVLMAFMFTLGNGYLNAKFLVFQNVNDNLILFYFGLILFFFGFYINFQSDSILINLRSNSTPNQKYFIPNEGFFKYVTSANYFGEIVEWTGFHLMCWNYASIVFLIGTCTNLIPRAIQSRKWYIEKFGDKYPKDRKSIFPFIF